VKAEVLGFIPILEEKDDAALEKLLMDLGIRLTSQEARRISKLLDRNPTVPEAFVFNSAWSEHCSYKSSRAVLREYLPTKAKHVILGPGEDAGVVRLGAHDGKEYVLVVAHESHNHPSQLLPVDGAATGIGGIGTFIAWGLKSLASLMRCGSAIRQENRESVLRRSAVVLWTGYGSMQTRLVCPTWEEMRILTPAMMKTAW